MPREVLIEFVGDPALTGVAVGTRSLRYGVDADEFVAKGMAKIVDEFPPPRSFLLTDAGSVEIGVMSGSQAKMSEEQRADEQKFLKAQVKSLDTKHEAEQEERRRRDAVATKRREVSRG